MTHYGLQTSDFLERMEKFEQELPPLLLELSQVVRQMIEEIERPQLEDVQKMQEELLKMLGDSEQLIAVCGTEGKLCVQCPFGAYLPTGFPFASPEQPLCLPWIVLTQPISKQQAENQQN
ncbi:MAG: hypothetical protein PHU44_16075 [Syntrophales bacterium]|nr:hypothetical protein [Syntrophales bacterium]MDD5641323.1 hypothetical protein [Syntrophales bacterium]